MASVSYQSSQTNTATSGTTVVVTKPVSLAVGDLMIAVCSGDPASVTPPSGWTALSARDAFAAFYKLADSTDAAATNFTFTFGGTIGVGAAVGISRFTGAHQTTPVDQVSAGDTSSITGITPTKAMGTFVIMSSLYNNGGAAGSASGYAIVTENPSWTEAFDVGTGSTQRGVALAYASRPGVAASGSASFTPSSYNDYRMWVLNIIPTDIPSLAINSSFPLVNLIYGPIGAIASTFSFVAPTFREVASIWDNVVKNVSSWVNQNKS